MLSDTSGINPSRCTIISSGRTLVFSSTMTWSIASVSRLEMMVLRSELASARVMPSMMKAMRVGARSVTEIWRELPSVVVGGTSGRAD
jgi:hypothetical protein